MLLKELELSIQYISLLGFKIGKKNWFEFLHPGGGLLYPEASIQLKISFSETVGSHGNT